MRRGTPPAAYLLAYAMPLRKINLTGKRPGRIPQLDAAEAKALILDGRGWSNKDRNSAYDKLSGDQLFELLGSWSPIVRDRAAMALGRRKDTPVPALVKMLDSPRLEARYGACQALGQLKGAAAPAVPALRKCLKDKDLWLRVEAAEALAGIGEPGDGSPSGTSRNAREGPVKRRPAGDGAALPELPWSSEPCSSARSTVWIAMLLQRRRDCGTPQSGRPVPRRRSAASIRSCPTRRSNRCCRRSMRRSSHPLRAASCLPAECVLQGIEVFAKHKIREGMPLCFDVMEIQNWGKAGRIPRCLGALKLYGAAAKPMLPRLRQLEKDLAAHDEAKNLKPHLEKTRELINYIENATGPVELRSLN